MIYGLSNKFLNDPTFEFNFDAPPVEPVELFENLKETMIHHKGLGLSANQVGLPYSVFVMGDPSNPDDVLGFFNPKIVNLSGEITNLEEGCLSYKGVILKVKRYDTVKIRATNFDRQTDTVTFTGLTARIIQHEFEHLQGITILDNVSRLKRDMALKKAAKIAFRG